MDRTVMDRTLEYLQECGVFFVAAADGGRPCVRPLSAVCLYDGGLYVMVHRSSALYGALKKNAAVEIAAVHPDKSRLLLAGRLAEDARPEAADAMRESNRDTLSAVYEAGGEANAVFRLEGGRASLREVTGRTETWTL